MGKQRTAVEDPGRIYRKPEIIRRVKPAAYVISREGVGHLVRRIFKRHEEGHPEWSMPEHLRVICQEIIDGIGRM